MLNLDAYATTLDDVISESVKVQVPYPDFFYRAEAKAPCYAYFTVEGSGMLEVSFDYSLGQIWATESPVEDAKAFAHASLCLKKIDVGTEEVIDEASIENLIFTGDNKDEKKQGTLWLYMYFNDGDIGYLAVEVDNYVFMTRP